MKVILLQDVPKVGKRYQSKDVKSGFARNFLIPQGLAVVATEGAENRIKVKAEQFQKEKDLQENLLLKNLESLEGQIVEMKEKANEKGHLFAGVHKEEIATELKKQDHIDMPAEYILLEHPIKELGEYDIEAQIPVSAGGKDKKVTFKLKIVPLE